MTANWQDKTIAGLNVRIRDGAADKCLVMLHGIGSNAGSFNRLAAYLPDDIMLIAWNASGYMGSVPLASPHPDARDYPTCLLDLIGAQGLSQVTLLGHSLGTLIATEFTSHSPQHVDTLILLACAQGYGIAPGAALPDKAAKRLRDLASLGAQTFAETRASRLMHDPDAQPDVRDEAIAAMAALSPDFYGQAVHMLASGTLSARAAQVSVPCLVLVGAQDQITPPVQSNATHHALASASPDLPHICGEIQNAGHILHQEQAADVATHIQAFTGWTTPKLAEAPL